MEIDINNPKTIKYNNEEYVLVDKYALDKETYYLFSSFNAHLFFLIKDNNYCLITDNNILEKLNKLAGLEHSEFLFNKFINKALLSLGNSDIKECSPQDKEQIIHETIALLKKTGCQVSEQEIRQKLEQVNYYYASGMATWGASATFNPNTNSIIIKSKNPNSFFHELVHSLQFKKNKFIDISLGLGIVEGAAEAANKQALGKNKGSDHTNFDTLSGTYTRETTVIYQMEYLLGEKSINSSAASNTDFYKRFAQKYGLSTYVTIKHQINKAFHSKTKRDEIFFKLQGFILSKCFDLEFKNVNDLRTANFFFRRLSNFAFVRYRNNRELDPELETYYNKKLAELAKLLNQKGVPEETIREFIETHRYRTVYFKSRHTKEEIEQKSIETLNKQFSNTEGIDLFTFSLNNENYTYAVKNGEVLYIKKFYDSGPLEWKKNYLSFKDGKTFYKGVEVTPNRIEITNEIRHLPDILNLYNQICSFEKDNQNKMNRDSINFLMHKIAECLDRLKKHKNEISPSDYEFIVSGLENMQAKITGKQLQNSRQQLESHMKK